MTTFNTTACKVKVNGQWTPLLAIGGSGGGGAHIATYGETTYEEISGWLDAGEWCVCMIEDEGFTGYLYPFAYTADEVMFCIAENEDPEMILKTSVSPDDGWGELKMSPLQITANLIGSYEDWISDPTLYPSTTAVEEYVAENAGGGGLMVHFSGSGSSVTCDHTVAQIVAAAASGPVSGEYNDNVYVLSQYGSSYAIFIYSGDYDYGGEDYYILSSNFGSNTWTLTEKFKADIYDIQDTNGNSLIDNDHIAVIPSGGNGPLIVWTEEGTNAEIYSAWSSGRAVIAKDTGGVIYNLVSATSTKAEFSRVTTRSYSGSALSEIQVEQQIVENDTWKHLSGYFSTS